MNKLLQVENLDLRLKLYNKKQNPFSPRKVFSETQLLKGIQFSIDENESLAIVGESGCGKSLTLSCLMQLLGTEFSLQGKVVFEGRNLLDLTEDEMRKIRGAGIAMIFQDPMNALNPTMRIGEQIAEALHLHTQLDKKQVSNRVLELLQEVGISDVALRAKQYPFEFSGGMLQRIAIAIALAGEPKLILADEPTTALDVTIQKQILQLIKNIQKKNGMALILVSHDLAVVAETADRVAVMYAGSIVEQSEVCDLFDRPSHPYTQGLLAALPTVDSKGEQSELQVIEGSPPDLSLDMDGCVFVDRCPHAMQLCAKYKPPMVSIHAEHQLACWLFSEQYLKQKS